MKRLNGVYLVIDPKKAWDSLIHKLESALEGGIQIVQVWNHWSESFGNKEKIKCLSQVKELCAKHDVPVLMHDDWELCLIADLDGVHFDAVPDDYDCVQMQFENKVVGVTVGNDMDKVRWAEMENLSYISFCSIFPSSSVDTCELVSKANIIKAKTLTDLPIFLAGGIHLDRMHKLKGLDFDGVALISGIMEAADPKQQVQKYIKELEKLKV